MANSAIPMGNSGPPLLRVMTPQGLTQTIRQQDAQAEAARKGAIEPEAALDQLTAYIRAEWDAMRNHRNGHSGWSERLLAAQRAFNGQYDANKLAEIRKFGGSEIYARLIAVKCRGATALLREVFLGPEKAWGLDPTPEPRLPEDVLGTVSELVMMEMSAVQETGMPIDPNTVRDRTNSLVREAKKAAKKKAKEEALTAENRLDDLLVEGGFYRALTEFLTDLPLFPFAVIKGPTVRIVPDVVWQNGQATTINRAKMFWNRVSPFDLYWSPGASRMEDAAVIERLRLTRADLNDLIGVPGYDEEAIRAVLKDYRNGGLRDWADTGVDSARAQNENREDPNFNRSGMIDCLEFHGNVHGQMLLDKGFTEEDVPDADRDYFVQAWLVGRYVIKIQISPSPRKRHPYYVTSFEKVPGTPVGNALPDILHDMQDLCNATMRSLVNNLSIASGPQVVVHEDRLAEGETGREMYPWKRWFVNSDPMNSAQGGQKPIEFFSVPSHAQELLGVYKEVSQIADELSAIPRYVTGSDRMGGAGRTASGLAMLMGNASKILQTVASNVDLDVMEPLLQSLYDMVMLVDDTGTFRGDEAIRVRGVDVAVQRETNRQRQIEALTATANPIDAQIMGIPGRARLLREVLGTVGIEGDIIPPEEDMAQAQAGGPMPPQMMPPGGPGVPQLPPGGNQPGPSNQNLGVPEGNAMRGMA